MADYLILPTRKGRLRYKREDTNHHSPPSPPGLFAQIQPRYHRPSRIVISQVNVPLSPQKKKQHRVQISTKLAGPRDSALRFLRSVIAQQSTQPKNELLPTRNIKNRDDEGSEGRGPGEDMPAVDFIHGFTPRQQQLNHAQSPLARPAERSEIRQASISSETGTRPRAGTGSAIPEGKPIAVGNGVSISVNLTEPLLFLQGFDQNDTSLRNTAMLRGSMHLKVQKSAKIKAVTLKFRGTALTKWPEGPCCIHHYYPSETYSVQASHPGKRSSRSATRS